MTFDPSNDPPQDLRSELRMAASESASIALKPGSADLEYLFRLRNFSKSGLGILVKKTSGLLRHIRVGDILTVEYHQGNVTSAPLHLKVEIRHISAPDNEKPGNHLMVGLYVLEKLGN